MCVCVCQCVCVCVSVCVIVVCVCVCACRVRCVRACVFLFAFARMCVCFILRVAFVRSRLCSRVFACHSRVFLLIEATNQLIYSTYIINPTTEHTNKQTRKQTNK